VAGPVLGVEVTVTTVPVSSPVKLNFGVFTEVILSVFEEPLSEAESKSGALGAGGTIEIAFADWADKFPALSLV
jgi:hypothetical protein